MDVDDYLLYVHDVRLEDYIQADPIQRSVLASLPTRNLVFTNADDGHARRVLRTLQIEEYFADIVDIRRMEPHCKPSLEAFDLAMRAAGESRAASCVMIDDLPHTTQAAKKLGMYTVLFGAEQPGEAADAGCQDWRGLPALLNGRHQ
jgi:pyrimidine 5'-nucleotidase